MANDALEQSLRAEIDKHFNARLNELREEMTRVQDLLNDTVSRHKTETDSIISNMMDKISSEDDVMNTVIAEHLRNAEAVAAQAAAEKAVAEAAAEAAAHAEAERAAAQAEAEQRAAKAEAEKLAAQSEAEKLAVQVEAEKAASQAALAQANAQAAAEAAARAAAEEAVAKAAEEKAAAEEASARAAEEQAAAKAAAETATKKISENIGLLRNAIVEFGKQKSQAEILKTLVGYAASLAPRVAFFVVKEGHTKGWRAFGFENTVGNDSINQIVIPLADETLLGESVNSQTTWDGTPGQFQDDYKLLRNLGSVTPNRIVAVPLIARSRSVAVLYADSGNDEANSINVDAIESLVRVAAMNVEMLAASRAAMSHGAATAPQPAAQPTEQPAPQTETVSAVVPEPVEETATTGPLTQPEEIPVVSFEPVAAEAEAVPVFVAQPVEEEIEEKVEAKVDTSFDLSGYEAVAPVESAPTMPIQTYAPVETPVERQTFSLPGSQPTTATITPLNTDSRFKRRDIDLPIEVSEEERRYHNEARRFARLLVSEIKLYNEPKVKEGRETRDLYERLREAIDRSREMYDKRVSPQVASKFDYFHYELVNTLAEGDENKLGGGYPGASV